MQFDNDSIDLSGVNDRRGMGGGGGLAMGGGGLGIVGVILYFVFQAVGGGGGGGTGGGFALPPGVQAGPQAGQSVDDLATRCREENALETHTDCRLVKVYNIADDVWREEFARRGAEYSPPAISFFTGGVRTQCGPASSSVGPFYCPGDREIYLDLDFLEQLQRQFGAPGQFAQAYIVAHEFGHHIQTLTGTERQVRAAQQSRPKDANELSVRMELQADCYAGVWAKLADAREDDGIALTDRDIAEAVQAAEAVGDDRIQEKTSGRVDPEAWTHGSAADRRDWFLRGYQDADVGTCDTFS
jgi:predicted metalloprotease